MQYMGDDVMYLWDGYKVGCWGVLYRHGERISALVLGGSDGHLEQCIRSR